MNKSILILEENSVVHGLIASALDVEGLTLHHEFNPGKFVDRATALQPDLILLSNTDQRGNYAVVRDLKSGEALEDIPIVLLANSRDRLDLDLLRDLHVEGVVRKPFEAGDLQQQVSRYLHVPDLIGAAYEYQKTQSLRDEDADPLASMKVVEPEVLELLHEQELGEEDELDEGPLGPMEIEEAMLAETLQPENAFEPIAPPLPSERPNIGGLPLQGEDFDEDADHAGDAGGIGELDEDDLLEEDEDEPLALGAVDEDLDGLPPDRPPPLDEIEVELSEAELDYGNLDQQLEEAVGEVELFEEELDGDLDADLPPPPADGPQENIPEAVRRMMEMKPALSLSPEDRERFHSSQRGEEPAADVEVTYPPGSPEANEALEPLDGLEPLEEDGGWDGELSMDEDGLELPPLEDEDDLELPPLEDEDDLELPPLEGGGEDAETLLPLDEEIGEDLPPLEDGESVQELDLEPPEGAALLSDAEVNDELVREAMDGAPDLEYGTEEEADAFLQEAEDTALQDLDSQAPTPPSPPGEEIVLDDDEQDMIQGSLEEDEAAAGGLLEGDELPSLDDDELAADLDEPDVGELDDYVQSELRTLEREDPLASEDAEGWSDLESEPEDEALPESGSLEDFDRMIDEDELAPEPAPLAAEALDADALDAELDELPEQEELQSLAEDAEDVDLDELALEDLPPEPEELRIDAGSDFWPGPVGGQAADEAGALAEEEAEEGDFWPGAVDQGAAEQDLPQPPRMAEDLFRAMKRAEREADGEGAGEDGAFAEEGLAEDGLMQEEEDLMEAAEDIGGLSFEDEFEALKNEIAENPQGEKLDDILRAEGIRDEVAAVGLEAPEEEGSFTRAFGVEDLPGEAAPAGRQPSAGASLLDPAVRAKLGEVLDEVITATVRKAVEEEMPRLLEKLMNEERER